MLFRKEKVDEFTKNYYILGFKFTRKRKPPKISKLSRARKQDALITMKCLRNLADKMNSIETIVLGSSSARYGFVENEKSINFGIDAQDLYYSYKIFEKYIDIIPNLKNIVLYFSIFAPGNNLEKSPQIARTAYYSAYLDIPYRNRYVVMQKGVLELEKKFYRLESYIKKNLPKVPCDLMTQNHKNINPEALEQRTIKRWLDLNRKATEIHYLEKILTLAEQNNCNALIVTCPYPKRVKESVPTSDEIFSKMYNICEKHKNVKIYNAFDDMQYTEEDFLDFSHLNRSGAEKITAKIRTILN